MKPVLATLKGAFCLVMLTRDRVYAARDPWGIRPMVLGRLADGWAVASESCALDTIGAQLIREVAPGELLSIGADGVRSESFSLGPDSALAARSSSSTSPARIA